MFEAVTEWLSDVWLDDKLLDLVAPSVECADVILAGALLTSD